MLYSCRHDHHPQYLRAKGYVSKPIAGRCGFNISVVDKEQAVLTETSGQFDEQRQIFQELRALPQVGTHRAQLSTFFAGGVYAGACARIDSSLIITTHSDLTPLCVVSDRAFLETP